MMLSGSSVRYSEATRDGIGAAAGRFVAPLSSGWWSHRVDSRVDLGYFGKVEVCVTAIECIRWFCRIPTVVFVQEGGRGWRKH